MGDVGQGLQIVWGRAAVGGGMVAVAMVLGLLAAVPGAATGALAQQPSPAQTPQAYLPRLDGFRMLAKDVPVPPVADPPLRPAPALTIRELAPIGECTRIAYGLDRPIHVAERSRWGTLWLGTDGGALGVHHDGNLGWLTAADGVAPGDITAIAVDWHGNSWFGTSIPSTGGLPVGGGLSRWTGETVETHRNLGFTSSGPFGPVRDLVSTDGDTLWIDMGAGSPDGDPIASRLYMLRPPRDWQHEPTAAGYRLDHVSSIVPDRYGNVFVRTDVNGEPVLVVRRRGYRWSADIGAGGPPNDAIRGIAREARGDQVWLLGNADGGDHLYLQTSETTWTDTGPLPNDIKSLDHMAGDAVGHLWWSNEDGLGVRWRGETSAGAPWWSAPTWRHLPPEGLLADSETLWLRTSDAHTVLIGLHTEVLGDLVVEIDCPVYEADKLTR